MRTKPLSVFFIIGILTLVVVQSGCTIHPFSGSAAMRIEVEVYKGPLSEEPEVQWASLIGHLQETEKGLIETDNLTRAVLANRGFIGVPDHNDNEKKWPLARIKTPPPPPAGATGNEYNEFCEKYVDPESAWYWFKFWRLFGVLDDLDHFDCVIIITLVSDIHQLTSSIADIKNRYFHFFPKPSPLSPTDYPKDPKDEDEARAFLQEVSVLARTLKDKAFRWAIGSTGGTSYNHKIRAAMVTSIVAASEYGNLLHARADALLKQLKGEGLDRRELPPSVALRGVEPTDFLHLYEWMGAGMGSISSSLAGIESRENRVKVVERLFADDFWAKINTVYASGRGKVGMAFIKDDVGNWNLKSFDNDPEELLNAYTDFAVTTIEKAAEIAADVVAPGAADGAKAASQLITMATQTAFGSANTVPVTRTSGILEGLRTSLRAQIAQKGAACDTSKDTNKNEQINECLDEIKGLVEMHGTVVDGIAKGLIDSDKEKSRKTENGKETQNDKKDDKNKVQQDKNSDQTNAQKEKAQIADEAEKMKSVAADQAVQLKKEAANEAAAIKTQAAEEAAKIKQQALNNPAEKGKAADKAAALKAAAADKATELISTAADKAVEIKATAADKAAEIKIQAADEQATTETETLDQKEKEKPIAPERKIA